MKRSPRKIAGLVLMGSGLLLTTGALFALVLAPPVYEAVARIAVPGPYADRTSSDTNVPPVIFDWFGNELERIRSGDTLHTVVTNLDLQSRWSAKQGMATPLSAEEAYRMLRERVEVQPIRGTSLFEIRVRGDGPTEPTRIANAIAHVYCDWRNRENQRMSSGSPLALVYRASEVVDIAEQPPRPTGRKSSGMLPLVLFGVGLLDILIGYFVIRPALAPRSE